MVTTLAGEEGLEVSVYWTVECSGCTMPPEALAGEGAWLASSTRAKNGSILDFIAVPKCVA